MSVSRHDIQLPGSPSPTCILDLTQQEYVTLPASVRTKAIRVVSKFIADLYVGTKSMHEILYLRYFQPPHDNPTDGVMVDCKLRLTDLTDWNLASFLRYALPTRIGEAVKPLNVLIDLHKSVNGLDAVDVTLTLYLAVAHSRRPGDEQLALDALAKAYRGLSRPLPDGSVPNPNKTLIWAHSNIARMLRKLGRITGAERHERVARRMITLAIGCTAAEIRTLIVDDVGTGEYIIDHPDIVKWLRNKK